jgi:hypothetical protein
MIFKRIGNIGLLAWRIFLLASMDLIKKYLPQLLDWPQNKKLTIFDINTTLNIYWLHRPMYLCFWSS